VVVNRHAPFTDPYCEMAKHRDNPDSGNGFIADFVRQESSRCNLSQAELAELTGISRTHISNIETGERLPTPETFKKICHALECDWGKAIETYLKALAMHHDWTELRRFLSERTTDRSRSKRLTVSLEEFPSRSRASARAMIEDLLVSLRQVVYETLQLHPKTPFTVVPSIDDANFKPYRDCRFLEYSPIIHTRETPGFSFGRFRIKGKTFAIHRHHRKIYEVAGTEAFVVERGQGILLIEKLPPSRSSEHGRTATQPRFARFHATPSTSGHYSGDLCHVWINPHESPLDVTITTVPFLISPKLKRSVDSLNDLEAWNVHPASYTLEEAEDAPIPERVRDFVRSLLRRSED
jgi:transcriptional regulator with XRE-family HTH domain